METSVPMLLALLLLSPNLQLPSVQTVQLLPDWQALAPVVVTLTRDHRLGLRVVVTAPAVESDVETLAVKADNQQSGYWTHRQGPNIFVKTERRESTGERRAARTRLFTSGAGKSLRDHEIEIDVEILDSPERRTARIRSFFEKNLPGQDRASIDAAAAYFDVGYIANPAGTYELTITYEPTSGIFAGRSLGQRLTVVVQDGPDSLDRIFNTK